MKELLQELEQRAYIKFFEVEVLLSQLSNKETIHMFSLKK